jgi:hypothetical protein
MHACAHVNTENKELHIILNCGVKDIMYNNTMVCSLTTSVEFKSPTRSDGEYTTHILTVCTQQTVNTFGMQNLKSQFQISIINKRQENCEL